MAQGNKQETSSGDSYHRTRSHLFPGLIGRVAGRDAKAQFDIHSGPP
jgi:hypothetical protein